MGRAKRKPEYDGLRLTEELFAAVSDSYHHPMPDESIYGHKKMELVAEEFNMSRLKVRKILITTGDYENMQTKEADVLRKQGLKTSQIAERMGMANCTVTSLLPYEKTVYKLEEISTAAERVKLFRQRKMAVEELKEEPSSVNVWKAIILFADYPFMTSGRGTRPGVKFKYTVSEEPSSVGKRYDWEIISGYGNEIFIKGHAKSISRSSVDYALMIANTCTVTGPKQLKIYGSSYVYAIFRRLGII